MRNAVIRVEESDLSAIRPWREKYRLEMNCQIIHDSLHMRPGWAREFALFAGGRPVGYGSVAVGGPWKERPAVFEFFVDRGHRPLALDLFGALLAHDSVPAVELQSNDPLGSTMLFAFCRNVRSDSILFHDENSTDLRAPDGIRLREPSPQEMADVPVQDLRWHRVAECDGQIVSKAGVLFHYNPPYGDIFMEVAEPHRNRGIGSYLVQELKRMCYLGGRVPAARCNTANIASRRTLQKAGFAACGHMLSGLL